MLPYNKLHELFLCNQHFNIHPSKKVTQHNFDRLYYFILGFYSSSLLSLESLFICLSIDALFVRVVSLGRMQAEYIWGGVQIENLQNGSICMGNACYAEF